MWAVVPGSPRVTPTDERGTREIAPRWAADPSPIPWVVLATKIHQTAAAGPLQRAVTGPDTVLVAAQNGVDHRERPADTAPAACSRPSGTRSWCPPRGPWSRSGPPYRSEPGSW